MTDRRARTTAAAPGRRKRAATEAAPPVPVHASGLPPRFHIDCAIRLPGVVLVVGWLASRDPQARMALSAENGDLAAARLAGGADGTLLLRFLRPDLRDTLAPNEFADGMLGFVFYWPLEQVLPTTFAVRMGPGRGTAQTVELSSADEAAVHQLAPFWVHAGQAFRALQALAPRTPGLARLVEDVEDLRATAFGSKFAACDDALLLNGRVLILNGWVARDPEDLAAMEVAAGETRIDLTGGVARYPRPDLHDAYPWSKDRALGVLAVLADARSLSGALRVLVRTRQGERRVLRPKLRNVDWPMLAQFALSHPLLADRLLDTLLGMPAQDPGLPARVAQVRRDAFLARHAGLPATTEEPHRVMAAVDSAFALGAGGLVVFGWAFAPESPMGAMSLRTPEGVSHDIRASLAAMPRPDVSMAFRERFPGIHDDCGFAFHDPSPTRAGDPRALSFDAGEAGTVLLKIPTTHPGATGTALVGRLLGALGAADQMRPRLHSFFDRVLGAPIEAVLATRPSPTMSVDHAFGEPPRNPVASVLISVGSDAEGVRRHLALLADDADFRDVDLRYVVEDPRALQAVMDTGHRLQALFGMSFRVISFSAPVARLAALNAVAAQAPATTLVFGSTDVLPEGRGWVGRLRRVLQDEPALGAVAPVLRLLDGPVRSAGCVLHQEPSLPGFRFVADRGRGFPPSEPPGVQAVECLGPHLIATPAAAFRALGGFDPGYLRDRYGVADYCRRLAAEGKPLAVDVSTSLWCLAAEEPGFEQIAAPQLATLYDAWRYSRKAGTP